MPEEETKKKSKSKKSPGKTTADDASTSQDEKQESPTQIKESGSTTSTTSDMPPELTSADRVVPGRENTPEPDAAKANEQPSEAPKKSGKEKEIASPSEDSAPTVEEGKPKTEVTEEESEDEGIEDIFSTEEMDKATRDALYERGVQYEGKNKKKLALRCYLQCLKRLSDVTKFSFLPQCLRKVADIYFEKEELEKAIQFIQAEKMYYETALIDTTELEKKLEVRKKSGKEGGTEDPKSVSPEGIRAEEYENLARLCLEQNQPQLALEYQGKATKLRQQTYGETHPLTTQSLDFFTVIYGEVGKQQYSESMEKVQQKGSETDVADESKSDGADSPQSILRRRKNAKKSEEGENKDDKKKQVRFAESHISKEGEEWISHTILWALFITCVMLLISVIFYLYCKVDTDTRICTTWRTELWYYYMRIKYMYHYYFASKDDQVVG